MKKILLATMMMTAVSFTAFAHEEAEKDSAVPSSAVVAVRSFKLTNNRGTAYAVLRRDGHSEGSAYQLEVRPYCKAGAADWKKLDAEDVETACDVVKDSLRFDELRQEISLDIFEADYDRYNEETRKRPGDARMHCVRAKSTVKISLKDYCKPARR